MKGQKGEGTKQNQSKGALGVAEAGPLFPRLHVNETEKAGPKAPPRNKMALYEQFTIPSHRFVQPSPKAATTMHQQQYGIHELGYPYVPYYAPSGPNHGVPMYARPSHNTSSSGAISSSAVNDGLRQMAHRPHKDDRTSQSRVSRHLTEATVDCAVKSLPGQKDNVAIVSAQSSLINQNGESTIISVQNTPSDMEVPHIPDITESLQKALSTVEVGTECTGPDVTRCEFLRGQVSVDSVRSFRQTVDNKLKQATQLSIFETLTQPTKEGASGPLDKSTIIQSYLITGSSRDECNADCGTQAMTSHAPCTMHSGTFLEPKGLDKRLTVSADCRSPFSSENQAITGQQSASTSGEILENDVDKVASKNFTTDVGKVDIGVGGFSKPSIAISEGTKGLQNGNSEVSRTSQDGSHKGGHFNGLPSTILDPMLVIKPKDVIRAVGQQQFWKARKKLLRQQRIFSDQVFQLHKLIKIQQLLAETPGTLIDEEMHLETREEIDAATPANRAATTSEDAYKMGLYFNERRECKSVEAEEQPRNKWGQTQADAKAGFGSNKCGPGMNSVGLSAWGYPSLGPWGGPIAAQGGPFNCQPFGGSLPPGAAFGFPFGPWPGSAASMMSFGIPYYERKQELPAEVDSNSGPPTAFKHDGIGTLSVSSNHMSNDLMASRYFAQDNHLNNHRLLAGVSKKESPTGSGASVNKSSATAQAVKASCFPGLSYHWGLEAGPLNAQQSESSLPSDACRLDKPSTPSAPAAKSLGFTHQDAGLAQDLDAGSAPTFTSLNQYSGVKRLVEKEKPVTRTVNHSKHQEDAVCSPVDCPDGNDYSSDVNPSALELFPLVPSLSASGWSRVGLSKAAEEGQGGVIRAVPRRAKAASKSAAGILLSLQRERQK